MNTYKTIRYIKKHNCSVSRYGDGEFKRMLETEDIGFQKRSVQIKESLISTLSNPDENVLICIQFYLNSCAGLKEFAKRYWLAWLKDNKETTYHMIYKYQSHRYVFGDSLITRPYMDKQKNKISKKIFSMLKSIWNGKDILIVEGDQTRLSVGNDLFNNANSIIRIIAPAENAFDSYSEIVNAIKKYHEFQLIVLTLGPTATVLANDLSKCNMQAIDVGHIDIEYEWFLSGANSKTPVAGKYTNECKSGRQFVDCQDVEYNNQIVCRIGDNNGMQK